MSKAILTKFGFGLSKKRNLGLVHFMSKLRGLMSLNTWDWTYRLKLL